MHEGEHLPDGGTEVHIGLGELRPGERQHYLFVLRQSEGLAGLGAVVGSREGGAGGDAGDEDAVLGHAPRAQRLGHGLVGDAEQVGVQMGPQPLGLVVSGHADDGEALARDHASAHGHVGGGDVGGDDGRRPQAAHILGELRVHEARPNGAAAPQKAPGESVAPGEVVEGARPTGEHGGGLVAVEHDAPEIEDVEDAHFRARFQRVVVPGSAGGLAGFLQRLGDGVGCRAVARAHRGVHYEDERPGDGLLGRAGRFGQGARNGLGGRVILGGRGERGERGLDRGGERLGGSGDDLSRGLRRFRCRCVHGSYHSLFSPHQPRVGGKPAKMPENPLMGRRGFSPIRSKFFSGDFPRPRVHLR